MISIYLVTNKENGKLYVGKTVRSIEDRMSRHYFQPSDSYLHRAMRKHGRDAFVSKVIDTAETNEEANEKEKLWIRKLNSVSPSGYNLTLGGDGMAGLHPSEETRAKLKEAARGNKKWLGRRHSEETKRKLSELKKGNRARLGMPHKQSTKDKLSKSHAGDKSSSAKLTWEQVREARRLYGDGISQADLCRNYGVNPSTMHSIVKNKTWRENA